MAEDNETNQKVILRQLALLGFAANVAVNGREALHRWRTGEYGLVLTDLHMPEMDGYELVAAIRAEENGANRTPIIALTANVIRGEAEKCRAAGMNDYLRKPASLQTLKGTLEKWLPPGSDAGKDADTASKSGGDPPVDTSVLKALVGDEQTVMRELLHDFKSSAAKSAVELRVACETGEPAQARSAAHKLKSSARSVGAMKLAEICAQLEHSGKKDRLSEVRRLLPEFETELRAVLGYLVKH